MSNTTFNIADHVPSDPLMAMAWRDCLLWVISEPMILKQFERDTGMKYAPARSPLERTIDKACGVDAKIIEAFVKWFNTTQWGDLNLVAGEDCK